MRERFVLEDICKDIQDYSDRYMKTVMAHMRIDHHRRLTKTQGQDVVLVGLDKCEHELAYEEPGYENLHIYYVESRGKQIAFCSADLVEALSELPDTQREVLLQTIVLSVPAKQLAVEYGVSSPMISKRKKQALDFLRKRLGADDTKGENHPPTTGRYPFRYPKR